ncbi:MAG: DUF1634 domain-containing protein [Candidatus Limnocylindrales bacterium]
MSSTSARAYAAERTIGRLLIAITYVSVGLLAVGFGLMIANGISPLDAGPPLDLATLGAQLLALDPAGFLWLGLLAVIAAPVGRVIVAAVSYGRDRDWTMVAISIAILAVIVVGVVTAVAVTV